MQVLIPYINITWLSIHQDFTDLTNNVILSIFQTLNILAFFLQFEQQLKVKKKIV